MKTIPLFIFGICVSLAATTPGSAVTAPLVVHTNGLGKVSPNYNGQQLEVGKKYAVTATALAGSKFVNWTSNQGLITNTAALNFVMQPDLVLTANFKDIAKPTLIITSPKAAQRILTNGAQWLVQGRATDNAGAPQVMLNCNGRGWEPIASASAWQMWMDLRPGPNTVSAFAVDAAGNRSLTNKVSFTYLVTARLVVQTNGPGKVSPNCNGQQLELGKKYSVTATAPTGAKFLNWTSNLDGITNTPTLSFIMRSNLVLTANFVDVSRPLLTITTPTKSATVTDNALTASGTATDIGGVASVFWKLNNGTWQPAAGTTQWSANLTLVSGPNTLAAYALDLAGNSSLTNKVTFTCAKDLLLLYWPMHDGDWKTFAGPMPNTTLSFHDSGFGAFDMNVDMNGDTQTSHYQYGPGNHELLLSGGSDFSLDPPIVELDDNILLKGGTRRSSSTMYFSGTSVAASVTMTVSLAGAVTVPAGTFADCRRADATVKVTVPGYGSGTATAAAYILAPRIGVIQVGAYEASGDGLRFVGWEKVTDGVVDGVSIRDLAAMQDATLENATESESAEFLSSGPQADEAASGASLEFVQTPQGTSLLKLSGRPGVEYMIEAEVSDGAVSHWDPFWVGTLVKGQVEIPIDSSNRHSAYRWLQR
jgi:hypothetical protein